jgi:hypothetical protein
VEEKRFWENFGESGSREGREGEREVIWGKILR